MHSITFLGPVGATFSHQAYIQLAALFNAPPDNGINPLVPATENREILPLVIQHGGFAAIAMETRAEGRVREPIESFISLLSAYDTESVCPFRVLGAVQLRLQFALLVRPGITLHQIRSIVAHPKALGACRNRVQQLGLRFEKCPSNGEAARRVGSDPAYTYAGAIGPSAAAEKYGLTVLDASFEDAEAVTTFFLLGPRSVPVVMGERNRVLIVFRTLPATHDLVSVLLPLQEQELSLLHIHSMHVGRDGYDYAIEISCGPDCFPRVERALSVLRTQGRRCLAFGPFAVHSV